MNDMSALDVDGVVIANTELVSEAEHNFVPIAGCSISSPEGLKKLAKAIETITQNQQPDLIILETSGASHPLPIVESLHHHSKIELTRIFAVVDAVMLAQDYANGEQLIPQLQRQLSQGSRSVENLLAEQIMFASELLLTKYDRIPAESLQIIGQAIHPLNPYISINGVSWGNLSLEHLRSPARYNFERVAGLIDELRDEIQNGAEPTDAEQNLAYQVIADERPFHPQRLWDTCHQFLSRGIYRSKGFFWLPTRDDMALLWNQAAGSINLELVSYWKSAVVEQGQDRLSAYEIEQLRLQLAQNPGRFGDRRCELTVIGEPQATREFSAALQNCFLTEDEIAHWQGKGEFADPWPYRFTKLNYE